MVTKEEWFQALAARHTLEGQKKLDAARVAVCGLGGLGSNAAIHLARCGIGYLKLIDFDRVDLPNINRQQYRIDQIGMPKTEALVQVIREFNPFCEIETHFRKLTEENIPDLLADCRVIIEAFDSPEQKSILVNTVLEKLPGAVLIAASGMAGYGNSNSIETKKISGHFYLCGDRKTGLAEAGTLFSPRVAICGAHEANLALQLIMDGSADD